MDQNKLKIILEKFIIDYNLGRIIDNNGDEEIRGITSEDIGSFIRRLALEDMIINKCIITTRFTEEAIDLHNHMDDVDFEKALKRPQNQYPVEWSFYNTEWYWWFDDKGKLAGNSGHSAINTALRLNPGATFYSLNDFMSAYPKAKSKK